jgi:hypothetical protein
MKAGAARTLLAFVVAVVAAPVADASGAGGVDGACVPGGLSLTITELTPGEHGAQTTAVYDLAVANSDAGNCTPRLLLFELGARPVGFTGFVDPSALIGPPGTVQHFLVSLTASTDATPGDHAVAVTVLDALSGASSTGTLDYALAPSRGCFVQPPHELFVTDLSVVEDPIRTTFERPAGDRRAAVWTFGHLMEQVAPTPDRAPALVEALLGTWLADQDVNGFTVRARPEIAPLLLDEWPRDAGGRLDLARAPLRLLAIVNRMDLRSLARGIAGQGRFVFGVVDPAGEPTPFTMILEYRLRATTERDLLEWARSWHELGELPVPSETFNTHLQAITDRFASRGADPWGANGSALATVRTNEIALASPWELRQFELAPFDGFLHLAPVDATPDLGFLGTTELAQFVLGHEPAILSGTFEVPRRFEGAPFRGGSAVNLAEPWTAPGIGSSRLRRAFSLGTCNGCHSIPETGTEFLQLRPRSSGTESSLSGFLTGAALHDPIDGEIEVFGDLLRRKTDLESLACRCGSERCEAAWRDLYRPH